MRVIGIDPGLRNTGWGVIERREGGRLAYIACGVIQTATGDLAPRLLALADGLRRVFETYEPAVASVEKTFVNRDPAGALKLGHARAIALLVPAEVGLPVFEYAPNEVKKTVVGVGHAGKEQVKRMVEILLPGAKPKTSDAADALAIAICHVQHSQLAGRIGA
ncbi:MAG: crossover junction endodeoxyribonuclease RuvC [Pseudomonadota bacterium]